MGYPTPSIYITQIKRISGAALIAASLAPTIAVADQSLPTLVVTAGRIAEDPARVSSSVTVIGEKEIQNAQVSSVAQLLKRQAGINIATSGGPGKNTSVYMRGGNSGHTLVLVDGVRVGAASTGAFDWGLMSPEDIEHIEIVRGPQSSLYGADAMTGVIQIFTKRGQGKPKVSVNAEMGGLSSSSGGMQVSGSTDAGISYALNACGLRTDGVSVAAKGTETDPFRQTRISGHVEMPLGEGELSLIARQSEGRNALDGGFVLADTLNWNADSRQSVYSIKASYPMTDLWESSLQLSRSSEGLIGHDPANAANNADIHTAITQLNWQNLLELNDLSVLLGFDYHADKAFNPLAPYNKELKQSAGFAAVSWHLGMLDLNGSARHDRNNSFTNKTTWHTGASVTPLSGFKLSANYGTGFKAPSINDLYWPGAGNANLKPESSRGWDVTASYERQSEALNYSFSAGWFDQKFENLIAWAPIAPGSWTWIPSNVNKARNRGLELSGRVSYEIAYLAANWTYLLARDSANDTWLARRPKESGNLLLGVTMGQVNLEGNLAIVGPRFSSPNNAAYMAGYTKLDISGSYQINPTWKLTGSLNNAGNKTYEEAKGYGVPGRVWHVGVGAEF